ncbi:branched-chain amino acid ABC transporter permease (plasmid) [Natrialbaceae archaeon A-arb3/5]
MSLRDITGVSAGKPTLSWEYWDEIKGTEGFIFLAATVFALSWAWLFARAPVVSDLINGYQTLAVTILIWAIFAMGYDLLLGQTGLLSFGHAAFWGGSMYASALFSSYVYGDPILMILVGVLTAVILAIIIGLVALRRYEVFFAVLTLAIGQFIYFMAVSPLQPWTGGYNGFTDVQIEPIFGVLELGQLLPGVLGTLWSSQFYLFVAAFFVLAVVFATRIVKSPYGLVFQSLRENEQRAKFVGIDVWRYRFMSFVLSAVFAGIAGSLFTLHREFVSVEQLHWLISGDVVIMAVLGGLGSVFGPILGAILYLFMSNIVQTWAYVGNYWFLITVLVFTTIVWIFPSGLWGIVGKIGEMLRAATRRSN